HHAALPLVGAQARDAVVGAANLEAERRLQVLALEQDLVAQPRRQARRRLERRLARHFVHAARQDVPDQAIDHRATSRNGGGKPETTGIGYLIAAASAASPGRPSNRPRPSAASPCPDRSAPSGS